MLFADRSQAASRFQGYLVHEELRRRGFESRLLAAPPIPHHDAPWPAETHARVAELVDGEILVFQKIWGPNAEGLRDAVSPATTTLYAQADLSPENPLPLRCDGVVCSSRAVAQWHESRGVQTWYVPDPAEVWLDPGRASTTDRVQICWIAHRKNLETLEPLRALLERTEFAAYELVTVSNDSSADVLWTEEAARAVLQSSQVGVVPVRRAPGADRASSNRAVAMMAAGLPVVADRLASYEEVIESGRTGYLCDSPADWNAALTELLDPKRRLQVAEAARAAVDPAYRIETICDQWLSVFRTFGPGTAAARRPRLHAYARTHEKAGFARTAIKRRTELPIMEGQGFVTLERHYGLPLVLGQALRAAAWAPAAPDGLSSIAGLARDLRRPVAGRVRAAVRRRLRR